MFEGLKLGKTLVFYRHHQRQVLEVPAEDLADADVVLLEVMLSKPEAKRGIMELLARSCKTGCRCPNISSISM